jgi:hypothetical protein
VPEKKILGIEVDLAASEWEQSTFAQNLDWYSDFEDEREDCTQDAGDQAILEAFRAGVEWAQKQHASLVERYAST